MSDTSRDVRPLLAGIGEEPPPPGQQFTVVMRGYDRAEVDAYCDAVDVEVVRLQELVAGIEARLRESEVRHRQELEAVRREAVATAPPTYAGFGQRVAAILASAQEEADELRASARAEADALRADSARRVQAEADRARDQAQADLGAQLAAAARAREEAESALPRAREEAERVVAAARARGQEVEAAARARVDAIAAERDELLRQLEAIRRTLGGLTGGA